MLIFNKPSFPKETKRPYLCQKVNPIVSKTDKFKAVGEARTKWLNKFSRTLKKNMKATMAQIPQSQHIKKKNLKITYPATNSPEKKKEAKKNMTSRANP